MWRIVNKKASSFFRFCPGPSSHPLSLRLESWIFPQCWLSFTPELCLQDRAGGGAEAGVWV